MFMSWITASFPQMFAHMLLAFQLLMVFGPFYTKLLVHFLSLDFYNFIFNFKTSSDMIDLSRLCWQARRRWPAALAKGVNAIIFHNGGSNFSKFTMYSPLPCLVSQDPKYFVELSNNYWSFTLQLTCDVSFQLIQHV